MSLHKKLTERNCSQTEKQKTVLFESETYSMTRVVRFMNKCFLVNQKQDQFVNQATHVLCGFYLPKRTNSIPTHFLGDLSIEMFKECSHRKWDGRHDTFHHFTTSVTCQLCVRELVLLQNIPTGHGNNSEC